MAHLTVKLISFLLLLCFGAAILIFIKKSWSTLQTQHPSQHLSPHTQSAVPELHWNNNTYFLPTELIQILPNQTPLYEGNNYVLLHVVEQRLRCRLGIFKLLKKSKHHFSFAAHKSEVRSRLHTYSITTQKTIKIEIISPLSQEPSATSDPCKNWISIQ